MSFLDLDDDEAAAADERRRAVGDLVLSLAQAQVRLAVRRHPWLKRRRPGAVVLVVPEGLLTLYAEAVQAVFSRWGAPKRRLTQQQVLPLKKPLKRSSDLPPETTVAEGVTNILPDVVREHVDHLRRRDAMAAA
jgi:hypothetical protein